MFRSKKKSSRSPRIQEKRRRARVKKLLLFVFGALLVFFTPLFLSRIPSIRIDTVIISGNELLEEEEMKDFIEEQIKGKIWRMYPRDNIFLVRKSRLEKQVRAAHPRIEEVEISRTALNELTVTLEERDPFALWCDTLNPSCLFIDDQGFAFASAPDFSAAVFLIFKRSEGGISIGSHITSLEDFIALRTFIDAIKQYDLMTTEVFLTGTDATLTLRGGGSIYLALPTLPRAFTNFVAILEDNELTIRDAGGLSVEYVDLRFDNKVFYKSTQDEL